MADRFKATLKRENALMHAALTIEIGDMLALCKDPRVHWDHVIPYLEELRRQFKRCDEGECRTAKRARAMVSKNRKER